jgi:hypothetical protein
LRRKHKRFLRVWNDLRQIKTTRSVTAPQTPAGDPFSFVGASFYASPFAAASNNAPMAFPQHANMSPQNRSSAAFPSAVGMSPQNQGHLSTVFPVAANMSPQQYAPSSIQQHQTAALFATLMGQSATGPSPYPFPMSPLEK